jgi:hypothetical protein
MQLHVGSIFQKVRYVLILISLGGMVRAGGSLPDGFFMYCTSNFDGTGSCVNQEDMRTFTCLIVPGQIITCPAKTVSTVDCVWISGVTASQAQFWCDPQDEISMYGEVSLPAQSGSEAQSPQSIQDESQAPIKDREFDGSVFKNEF